jgi:glycosyltransferase involved in cell wall biosynthesis
VKARHVFLATEGAASTVYASQVAGLLRVLDRDLGLRFELLDLDPLAPATWLTGAGRRRRAALAAALPGPFSILPFVPYEDRAGLPWARRAVRWALAGDAPLVVHARGLWAGVLAADLVRARGNAAFVYDARGDALAEHAHHRTGRGDGAPPGTERLRAAEAEVCAGAERILCVSTALRDVLEARHGGVAAKAAVVPCCVDPAAFRRDPAARALTRGRLGLADRWVLAYAGSLVPYQLPERVARLGALARGLRPHAHLLWLTPEPDQAQDLARAAGLSRGDVTCRRVPHHEVPRLLNAADAAVLLRRRDPVNRVASPTKAAEYLACGLPLLTTPGLGDVSDLVTNEGLGVVISDPDDDAALRAGLEALLAAPPDPDRVAAWARDRLARDRHLATYRDLYAALAAAAG